MQGREVRTPGHWVQPRIWERDSYAHLFGNSSVTARQIFLER